MTGYLERSVLLVGGPDAGKTNYLCRVWLSINAGDCALSSQGLPDDLRYLQEGADTILQGNFVPHTPTEVRSRCQVPVRYAGDSPFSGNLVVPDYSGETWHDFYRTREWSEDWESLLNEGCGCLIFVRAGSDELVPALDWMQWWATFGQADKAQSSGDSAVEQMTIPTQVRIVDCMQCLIEAFQNNVGGGFRPRIGIVVAAWDRVPEDSQALLPSEYVAREFPLVADFLAANSGRYLESATFGLSITGGDLGLDAEFRTRYLEDPGAFGFVIHELDGERTESTDLTLPLTWAMNIGK